MAEREDVIMKKQQAAEAMQRARQAQLENARMQRELQAAARELARHQAEAAKARDAMLAAGERARATTQSAGQSIAAWQESGQQGNSVEQPKNPVGTGVPAGGAGNISASIAGAHSAGATIAGANVGASVAGTSAAAGVRTNVGVSTGAGTGVSQDEYWAGGRKAAEQRAAQQRAILQAAERRALKKQAAEEAAALLERQRAQEARKHHTSPETKQLQNLLLQQITEIMEEDREENPVPENAAETSPAQKRAEELQTAASGDDTFGDLVFLDANGEETKPEPPNVMKKALEDLNIESEEYGLEETAIGKWGNLGQWFQTICWMHIPIIGFWYLVIVAIRRKTPKEKKTFARAYILFRILVLILACTVLYVFYQMGISFIEQILSYINAHL